MKKNIYTLIYPLINSHGPFKNFVRASSDLETLRRFSMFDALTLRKCVCFI